MDAEELAAKVEALEAELATKSSRIADLEARVSLLDAENARLRRAMPKGKEVSGRLEEGLSGEEQNSVDMVGAPVVYDVIEISDGEDEEGIAVDVRKGKGAEEGILAVPTPRKSAVRTETGESEDEDGIENDEGGSGGKFGSIHCDGNMSLDDDDVSITPRGKKYAPAWVVTSDSEDEVENDKDGEVQEEEVGVAPSTKRALNRVNNREDNKEHASMSEEDDEDDMIPICQVGKKIRKEKAGRDDGELDETIGCSTPATRRSTRLVKSQPKRGRAARRMLNFVEPKECEHSEDDSEEDDDMDEFIVDDDCSENSNSADESSAGPEESDGEVDYKEVMACIGRKRNAKDWKFEAEMLSAFAEYPELCLKAVCALYRKQTKEEQSEKATIVQNKQGFSQIDAKRGSRIAEFLLDGDAFGPLKKTVHDLEKYDPYALEFCRKVAARYSKQLFAIYENKEDPFFP